MNSQYFGFGKDKDKIEKREFETGLMFNESEEPSYQEARKLCSGGSNMFAIVLSKLGILTRGARERVKAKEIISEAKHILQNKRNLQNQQKLLRKQEEIEKKRQHEVQLDILRKLENIEKILNTRLKEN